MTNNNSDGKMILFHGLSQEEIAAVINFIRTTIDPNRTIACSMTVNNVMDWPVKELIAHVLEEHSYMQQLGNKQHK